MNYFIGEDNFRVWLPDVDFVEKSQEAFNSRQLFGVMSTGRKDRQGENVLANGLDFSEFLTNGHFNDNHSQETSAIVGYPERVQYHSDLATMNPKMQGVEGWTCHGYVLKGTKRADGIWELAKALMGTPDKRLGFSIEGKVIRRNNKVIEKAQIRNVAITNCPVNTDATWEVLSKSFVDEEIAMKAMAAGFATTPATQSGGGALRPESLDSKVKKQTWGEDEKKKKKIQALKKALSFDELSDGLDAILEQRPDFDEAAAAHFIVHLFKKGGTL